MGAMLGQSGICDDCGRFDWLWTGDGQRCDRCQTVRRVRADYASDPDLARRVYCAADAEAALRLLGVPAETTERSWGRPCARRPAP